MHSPPGVPGKTALDRRHDHAAYCYLQSVWYCYGAAVAFSPVTNSTRLSIFYFIFNFLLFEVKRANPFGAPPSLLYHALSQDEGVRSECVLVCPRCASGHLPCCAILFTPYTRVLPIIPRSPLSSLSPCTSLVARHPAPPPDLTPPCHIQLTHMPRAIAKLIRSEGLSFVFHTHFFHM